jgi:glutathione synthase
MFFTGLDIIGSKLIEINVFSPGGLLSASKFTDVEFSDYIIQSLEHKIYLKALYQGKITNKRLAIL